MHLADSTVSFKHALHLSSIQSPSHMPIEEDPLLFGCGWVDSLENLALRSCCGCCSATWYLETHAVKHEDTER